MKYPRSLLSLAAALCVAVTSFAADKSNPDVLRVALLPDENAATIIQKNEGLKHYLEQSIGKPIELVVTTDYSSMIEAMRHGRIELGYFGPLSYVLARQHSDTIVPFAVQMKHGAPTYRSVFIANAASGVHTLGDVKGKTVAWGDQASTSSHLIPKCMLHNAGLDAGRDYAEQFVGSHDAVALAVQNGKAQAGGLSEPILQHLIEKGTIKSDRIVILGYSDPFPNYPWTMQSYLQPELQEKIRAAFMNLKDPTILKNLQADSFGPIADRDYNQVRQLGKTLHLDLAKL